MLDVVDDRPTDLEGMMDSFGFGSLKWVLIRFLRPADHRGLDIFEGLRKKEKELVS